MPSRAERRAAGEKARVCIRVTVGGNPYEIYLDQIRGDKEAAFMAWSNQMVGQPLSFLDILTGQVDTVHIAGVVWAVRSPFEKKLQIGDVLKEINMGDLQTLEIDDGEEDEDAAAPAMTPHEVAADPEDTGGS